MLDKRLDDNSLGGLFTAFFCSSRMGLGIMVGLNDLVQSILEQISFSVTHSPSGYQVLGALKVLILR